MNLIIALLAIAASSQVKSEMVNSKGVNLRCGEYSLAVSLRALDIAAPDAQEFEQKLGQPGPMGFSLKQLEDVAKLYGAYTLGVDTNLEQLERREGRFACIALDEERGHFFCIADIDPEKVIVVDPPDRQVVSRDVFAKLWNGRALLISREPISVSVPRKIPAWIRNLLMISLFSIACLFVARVLLKYRSRKILSVSLLFSIICTTSISCTPKHEEENSMEIKHPTLPVVTIEPQSLRLGLMEFMHESTLGGEFVIRNLGNGPLRLLESRVSCGCTTTNFIPSSIAPGGSTVVKVKVKAKNSIVDPGFWTSR